MRSGSNGKPVSSRAASAKLDQPIAPADKPSMAVVSPSDARRFGFVIGWLCGPAVKVIGSAPIQERSTKVDATGAQIRNSQALASIEGSINPIKPCIHRDAAGDAQPW